MSSALIWLTEPFQLGFFVRGLITAVLVLIGGAMLGFGVLTRRTAYFGQGVSQAMLAGVALGASFSLGSTVSAFASALVAAALITLLARTGRIGTDAAIAVVSSAMFSGGVVVISSDRSRAVNLSNLLFGNVLGVTWTELAVLAVAVAGASLFSIRHGRQLALAAIAPQVATAHGVPLHRLELFRQLTLALVTAASVQVVGVTLVVAALVLPAAVGTVLTRTLGGAHVVAVTAACITGVAGLYVSYWFDLASGPAVVLTGTTLYLVALIVARLTRR
jgi:ABC-type Mn2+/Zn2+ transport system permease subunit